MQPFKLGINKFAIKAKFGNLKTMNLGLVQDRKANKFGLSLD